MAVVERVTTGVERLDEILDGGIPHYSQVFIVGMVGTGKTILTQQCLFANALLDHTGLYLTTISEPSIKVVRYMQAFDFFDKDLFGKKVVYADIGGLVSAQGWRGAIAGIDSMVKTYRPFVVAIDSYRAIRDIVGDPVQFREFTYDLSVRLATWEVTSLLVGDYCDEDISTKPEFAIADGIIYLYGTEEVEKQKRFLRIMKMRGTPFFAGEHLFEITSAGISVYPRMRPEVVGEYEFPGVRIGSAIEGFDEMLDGGLYEGTVTIISGGTGSGKTLVAMSFLVQSTRQGRPGLFVTFEESPKQVIRNVQPFGWDLQALVDKKLLGIVHVSPSELDVDKHAFLIKDAADQIKARVVVIDSISAFEAAVPNLAKYQNYLWAISDHFKRHGVTVILTAETAGLFGAVGVTTRGVSFVADNIIFLRYVEVGGEARPTVSVLKMRGSGHGRAIRELSIDPPRVAIGPKVTEAGILGGATHRGKTRTRKI